MSARIGPALRAHLDFFAAFLKRPQDVGSVIPSSRYVEQRIVSLARVGHASHVVELGPGTGGTTRAILAALPPAAKLLTIEITPSFARSLREWSDRRLVVHEGNALDLRGTLRSHGFPPPEVVISGIPFSSLDRATAMRLLREIHEALPPSGRFIAYQLRDDLELLARSVFGKAQVAREFRNIPPLRFYRWRKATRNSASPPRPDVALPSLEQAPETGGVVRG